MNAPGSCGLFFFSLVTRLWGFSMEDCLPPKLHGLNSDVCHSSVSTYAKRQLRLLTITSDRSGAVSNTGLALEPVIGAISAGNAVALKPSECAPASAQFLADTIPKYLDNNAVKVFLGGPQVGERLLERRWDKIFFTGNTNRAPNAKFPPLSRD